jgi:uncharacterized CHY-type Zn-finger protein
VKICDTTVTGVDIDPQTRCAHYHSERDVVAIKFKCCRKWFSCHQCHAELGGHATKIWTKEELRECAVMCGNCGKQMTISAYLECGSVCPNCQHQFNPGCANHHHLYFETLMG